MEAKSPSTKGSQRNKYDIIASVLRIARNGATKTRIMYYGNLSFQLRKEYLDTLIELGLVETDGEKGNIYRTTKKGLTYLSIFVALKKLLS